MKTYTKDEVIAAARKEIGKSSLRQTALRVGMSAGYLSDALNGKRHITEAMAEAFGFSREIITQVVFRKIA